MRQAERRNIMDKQQCEYNVEIFNVIKAFLQGEDWPFTADENKGLFFLWEQIRGRVRKLQTIIDVHDDGYLVYTFSPISAEEDDEATKLQLAALLSEYNYSLLNGNAEIDLKDGDIRYKVYVDCENQIPNDHVIFNSIYCGPAEMKVLLPAICCVVFQNGTWRDGVRVYTETRSKIELEGAAEEEFDKDIEVSEEGEELIQQTLFSSKKKRAANEPEENQDGGEETA